MHKNLELAFSPIESVRWASMPQAPDEFPLLERVGVQAPGEFDQYHPATYDESYQAVIASDLPTERKLPLLGYLSYGGIVTFPGGVGCDYKTPFKVNYKPEFAIPAAMLFGRVARNLHATAIVAPDIAPNIFARDVSREAGDISVLRVLKDGKHAGAFGFRVPSYTRGQDDFLYFDADGLQDEFDELPRDEKVVLYVVEDIADTGQMIRGIVQTVNRMRDAGAPIRVAGAAVIIEKLYTGAGDMIRNLGVPLESAIQIEDLWSKDEQGIPGIKVPGIDSRLTFRKQQQPH